MAHLYNQGQQDTAFHTQANIKCMIFLLLMLLTCNVLVKCMQEIVIINNKNITNEPKK